MTVRSNRNEIRLFIEGTVRYYLAIHHGQFPEASLINHEAIRAGWCGFGKESWSSLWCGQNRGILQTRIESLAKTHRGLASFSPRRKTFSISSGSSIEMEGSRRALP